MNTLNEDLVKGGCKPKYLKVSWDHTSYMRKGSVMSIGVKYVGTICSLQQGNKYTTHRYPNFPGEMLPQVSFKYS